MTSILWFTKCDLVPRRWTEHAQAAWHVPGPRARLTQGTTIRLQQRALQAQREEKERKKKEKREEKREKGEKKRVSAWGAGFRDTIPRRGGFDLTVSGHLS